MTHAMILLATFAQAVSNDDALPGRDGNYDIETSSLVGTVWEGKIVFDDTSIVRFDRNGVLRIKYFGQTNMQANWRKQGDTIIIEINNKYVECQGKLHGERMTGTARNKADPDWKWEMKKLPASSGKIFGDMP